MLVALTRYPEKGFHSWEEFHAPKYSLSKESHRCSHSGQWKTDRILTSCDLYSRIAQGSQVSLTNRSSLRGFHGAFAGEEMTSELRWYNHLSYLVGHDGSASLRGAAVPTLAAEIKRLTKREIGGKLWNKLLVLEDFIRGAADGTTRFPSLLSSGSRTSADHQQT